MVISSIILINWGHGHQRNSCKVKGFIEERRENLRNPGNLAKKKSSKLDAS